MNSKPGYAAGNILNMLVQIGEDLTGYDFSGLAVWGMYAQGISLQHVNFSEADVSGAVFQATFGQVRKVQYSPDGSLLAMAASNHEVYVWRVRDISQILKLDIQAHAIAFHPNRQLLATGDRNQIVRLWDLQTGQCVKTLHGKAGYVNDLAFTPDGTMLAIAGGTHVCLWNMQSEECQSIRIPEYVTSVAVSIDGVVLAVGTGKNSIQLWHMTSQTLITTLRGHTEDVWTIAFNPNGEQLASGSYDQTVRLWDAKSGRATHELKEHVGYVRELSYSPDGQMLASCSNDRSIKLWDAATGNHLKTFDGHTGRVFSVSFSADGLSLASGSSDQTLRLWNTSTTQCFFKLQGYINPVWIDAFCSDGQVIACRDSRSAYIWNVHTGERVATWHQHHTSVSRIAFDSQAPLVVSIDHEQKIRVWQMEQDADSDPHSNDDTCLNTLFVNAMTEPLVAVSQDTAVIATIGNDKNIHLWNRKSGKCVQTLQGHTGPISSIAFSPWGQLLASGGMDQVVRLWDCTTGELLATMFVALNQAYPFSINAITFSPDGQTIAMNSSVTTVDVWHIATAQRLQTFRGHSSNILSLAFDSYGTMLASGSRDQTVCLWDVPTGNHIATLREHTGQVTSVIFSPDGQLLASSSDDGVIKIWQVKTGKCLHTLLSPRPYEQMNIAGTSGLTDAQRETLKALGAVVE